MNALTHCVRYAPYKGDAFFPPPKTLCTPLHTLDPLTSQLLSSLLSWPSPASRVSAFLRPVYSISHPYFHSQAHDLLQPEAAPNKPSSFFFPLKFPVSLYGTEGQSKFLSKGLESCFESREWGVHCPLHFPCRLCSSGPVDGAEVSPLHPNEGRWNGLNLGAQCSPCGLRRAFEQHKSASTN